MDIKTLATGLNRISIKDPDESNVGANYPKSATARFLHIPAKQVVLSEMRHWEMWASTLIQSGLFA